MMNVLVRKVHTERAQHNTNNSDNNSNNNMLYFILYMYWYKHKTFINEKSQNGKMFYKRRIYLYKIIFFPYRGMMINVWQLAKLLHHHHQHKYIVHRTIVCWMMMNVVHLTFTQDNR